MTTIYAESDPTAFNNYLQLKESLLMHRSDYDSVITTSLWAFQNRIHLSQILINLKHKLEESLVWTHNLRVTLMINECRSWYIVRCVFMPCDLRVNVKKLYIAQSTSSKFGSTSIRHSWGFENYMGFIPEGLCLPDSYIVRSLAYY